MTARFEVQICLRECERNRIDVILCSSAQVNKFAFHFSQRHGIAASHPCVAAGAASLSQSSVEHPPGRTGSPGTGKPRIEQQQQIYSSRPIRRTQDELLRSLGQGDEHFLPDRINAWLLAVLRGSDEAESDHQLPF